MGLEVRMRFHRRQRGLTLIEVLVALSILAVALLALFPLFTVSVKTNASSHQLTNANTLAREKLEELSGYPRNDPRLTIADGSNAAAPAGVTIPGTTFIDTNNPYVVNDLPKWYEPSTGAVSTATTSPGITWFAYPYTRTYTIEQFDGTLTNRITSPGAYVVKLITVTVQPTQGPFPGLRRTTQSLYLRLRNV
jgi:prepilin-type N-terminal cleavage/methylation domain-containing protein